MEKILLYEKVVLTNIDLTYYSASIPAGFPSPAADYIEETIDLNKLLIKTPSATFFVRVDGDSMIDAFIPTKSLLMVDKSLNAKNGDIVVAVVNGEFTVKRLVTTLGGTFLSPANKKYKPIKLTQEMDFKVWGVVTNIIINSKEI